LVGNEFYTIGFRDNLPLERGIRTGGEAPLKVMTDIAGDIMALKLKVPTLDHPGAADAIKEVILTAEPDAKVDMDMQAKTVTVEAKASEETFKQLIEAAGHPIEGS
jgi:copper chaperone